MRWCGRRRELDDPLRQPTVRGRGLNQSSRPRTDWLLLAGFCGFLFFFGLAYFGLLGADEPRYAQVAREMLARHDWVTPTLGGKPWLEKPVLYYWQAMLAYSVFGVSDWAARLPSAVDATLMVVAIYLFLRRFRPGFQLDGALMAASMAGVVGFARAASTDMPLAATLSIALLAWYAWHETTAKHFLAGFYVFVGLGMLAKGPVAPFLAAAIIAIFAVAKGEWRLIWRTLWIPGVLLFCAVALPWYVLVQMRNPEFFRVFILEHNLSRFGSNLYHHREPFWYYVPVVLLGLVPWTVFMLVALAESARAWWAGKRQMLQSDDALDAFCVIWMLVPVLFFSVSQSKLPGYVLPVFPAGAVLLAEYVRRKITDDEATSTLAVALHAVVAASPLVPALMIQYLVLQHRLPWGDAAKLSTMLAVMLAVAVAVTLRSRFGLRVLRFVTLVPVVLVIAAVLKIHAPAVDANLSARPVAAELDKLVNKPMPLALFRISRETEYGLQFYRNQTMSRYGLRQIPDGEHLLVAAEGSQADIARLVPGRRVSYLGSFAPQGLDFFWVSSAGMTMEMGH
jgi:4-amino-4-deoxy-L-arabinose transferase-like glycosyltransferase